MELACLLLIIVISIWSNTTCDAKQSQKQTEEAQIQQLNAQQSQEEDAYIQSQLAQSSKVLEDNKTKSDEYSNCPNCPK